MTKSPTEHFTLLSRLFLSALIGGLLAFTDSALANEAEIIDATIEISGATDNRFRINVTIKHDDEGWDHYANQWDILDEQGELLGSRVLHHPHVNEQPFTRSLTLVIPATVKTVTIVAHDSVHKDNPVTASLAVPGRQ